MFKKSFPTGWPCPEHITLTNVALLWILLHTFVNVSFPEQSTFWVFPTVFQGLFYVDFTLITPFIRLNLFSVSFSQTRKNSFYRGNFFIPKLARGYNLLWQCTENNETVNFQPGEVRFSLDNKGRCYTRGKIKNRHDKLRSPGFVRGKLPVTHTQTAANAVLFSARQWVENDMPGKVFVIILVVLRFQPGGFSM